MSDWWNRLMNAFNGLEARERLLVSIVAGLVVIALLYVAVIGPILRASYRGEDRLASADQRLQVMQRLRRDYDDVQGRLADVEQRIRRGARSELRTTLESLAQQASVKVESMEPQASPAHPKYRETKVEVGLKNVTLAQTVHYLHEIDIAPQALSVKSLRIRTRAEQPDLLDVTFTVSSFEPI
ncbi:MAG TPA: type II secretion system protein GspM [Myxococcota bacterium]|nr:type II secretion system protein GspM [Myxococcota bacterium]